MVKLLVLFLLSTYQRTNHLVVLELIFLVETNFASVKYDIYSISIYYKPKTNELHYPLSKTKLHLVVRSARNFRTGFLLLKHSIYFFSFLLINKIKCHKMFVGKFKKRETFKWGREKKKLTILTIEYIKKNLKAAL